MNIESKRQNPKKEKGTGRSLAALALMAAAPLLVAPPGAPSPNHARTAGTTAQVQNNATNQERQPLPSAPAAVSTATLIDEMGGGILYGPSRRGMSPKERGCSVMCARMVRKNRMRGMGIRGARI